MSKRKVLEQGTSNVFDRPQYLFANPEISDGKWAGREKESAQRPRGSRNRLLLRI